MNSSRQLLLGLGVFFGGGVLLYAMVQQIDATESSNVMTDTLPQVKEVMANEAFVDSEAITSTPLTADIATEQRILEEKRRLREAKVAEMAKHTSEFMADQERAEALAMKKAREENEQYRKNAIEPIMDEPIAEAQDAIFDDADEASSSNIITKPVVVAREIETVDDPEESLATANQQVMAQMANQNSSQNNNQNNHKTENQADSKNKTERDVSSTSQEVSKPTSASLEEAPKKPLNYTVQRGDGLIVLSRRYNVPLSALAQTNKLKKNTPLRVGQELVIPSAAQIDRLVRDYESNTGQAAKPKKAKESDKENSSNSQQKQEKTSNKPPTRQTDYTVARGDGLIKLARQYNVPVEALAQANNISTNTSLKVGQELTIPSRKQIARLQREAEKKQREAQTKREAQKRLVEARREAANGEAKGVFGVQVALADNKEKADEIVKKMKAAGYTATTSETSRGVRVIVGPEKGKAAALALKDKINADARADVDGAWVLYWR